MGLTMVPVTSWRGIFMEKIWKLLGNCLTLPAKSISKVMEVLFIIAFIAVVSIYIYFDHQRSLRYREKMEKEAMMHDEERANAIAKMNTLIFVNEVKHQAALVGDQATIEAVDADTYDGPIPYEEHGRFTSIYPDRLLILSIAGINYYGNLRAYVGDFKGVLVPEPKNDYDPKAIKVVCEDGKKLGYVPEYETDNVRRLIAVTDPNNATWRHRITGNIEECEEDVYDDDEKPRKFFVGQMYIAK